jgi:hypothetical protein
VTTWQDRAACRGITVVMFPVDADRERAVRTGPEWPAKGSVAPNPDELAAYATAKAVCAACPVLDDCAVDMHLEQFGVRAGTAPHERCVRIPSRADKVRERLAAADDGRDPHEVAARAGVTTRTVWRHRQLRLGA